MLPFLLMMGGDGIFSTSFNALCEDLPIQLVQVSTFFSVYQEEKDLCGAIYILTGKQSCASIIDALFEVNRGTGIPQLILCEHLEDFFRNFSGVTVLPLTTPLWCIQSYLQGVVRNGYKRVKMEYAPAHDPDIRELLHWMRDGLTIHEMANRWQISLRAAYGRRQQLFFRLGIHTKSEQATLRSIADRLLSERRSINAHR